MKEKITSEFTSTYLQFYSNKKPSLLNIKFISNEQTHNLIKSVIYD